MIKKCSYVAHILRGERYEYQCLLLESTVHPKRGRGRIRNIWFSNIRDWMGIDYATAARKVQDHNQLQSVVSKVPDGYATHD